MNLYILRNCNCGNYSYLTCLQDNFVHLYKTTYIEGQN